MASYGELLHDIQMVPLGSLVKITKDGHALELTRFERTLYGWSSGYRKAIDQKVNEKITAILTEIQASSPDTQTLKTIFVDQLSHLHSKQFDRGKIPESIVKRLYPVIEDYCPLVAYEKPTEEYKKAIDDVRLALALDPLREAVSPLGGTSTVKIFKDIHGTNRLVVKPVGEDVGPQPWWKRFIKKILFIKSQESYLVGSEAKAEVTATFFAKKLGFQSIAETHLVQLSGEISKRCFGLSTGREASAQLYVQPGEGESAVTADDFFQNESFLNRLKTAIFELVEYVGKQGNYTKEEIDSCKECIAQFFAHYLGLKMPEVNAANLTELQKFWIFDFLIGNLDRHGGNWLLLIDKATQEIRTIKGIDQGAAFYWKHPETFLAQRNQYRWDRIERTQEAFTEEAMLFVRRILESSNLLIGMAETIMCQGISETQRSGILKSIEERIDILRYIEEKKIETPKQLASYKNTFPL